MFQLTPLDSSTDRFGLYINGEIAGKVVWNDFDQVWHVSEDNYVKSYSNRDVAANALYILIKEKIDDKKV